MKWCCIVVGLYEELTSSSTEYGHIGKNSRSRGGVIIKKSKIFFRDLVDDTLFILKIDEGKFFYDYNKLENILIAKNKIFNLSFSLEVKNEFFNKKLVTNFNFNKIRLKIENEMNYKDKKKNGTTSIDVINKGTKFKYKFDFQLI